MVRAISYFPTEADALTYTNPFTGNAGPNEYAVETISGHSSWRISSASTGSSSQSVVYTTGDILNNDGAYRLYVTTACFLEGTQILCDVGVEKYVPIEQLKPGDFVKTSLHGFKKIQCIGKRTLQNPGTNERIQNRLYKCSTGKYSELTEDLYITGCHSILVDTLTEDQREETKNILGNIYVTDKKYRLMVCVDSRAEPWSSEGTYTIWNFALENEDRFTNYGIWANGGLLVESCSINFMENKSNMTLL